MVGMLKPSITYPMFPLPTFAPPSWWEGTSVGTLKGGRNVGVRGGYPTTPLATLDSSHYLCPPLLVVGGHKCGNFEGREDASEQYQEDILVGGQKCESQRWWAS